MEQQKYFLGLDIGTDSVGYAVTNENYALSKFKGEPMWGVHLFEEAALSTERRGFRSARRRLDRRQQRIKLTQEIFAKEIAKIDEHFFIRIKESYLYPEDTTYGASLLGNIGMTDSQYGKKYPTIHHLICELMEDNTPHDIRLVYIACAWLIGHRGHFLNEISRENIESILDISAAYNNLMEYFTEDTPWVCNDLKVFGEILKQKNGISKKYRDLCMLLFDTPKVSKDAGTEYSTETILKALCGSKISAKDLFRNEEYAEIDSFVLDKSDEELAPVLASLGDDAELVIRLKAMYDWAILSDVLKGESGISRAKIKTYEKHKDDLKALKHLIKTYLPQKYNSIFRSTEDTAVNYEIYAKGNSGKQEDFCKAIKNLIKNISPSSKDKSLYEKVLTDLEKIDFCPKQVNSDNRVIPYQVYWTELNRILETASDYLPFLTEKDNDGYTPREKLLSIFEYRIPYFVGPLNSNSPKAWLKRKPEGRIYPWNFNDMIDLEASEQAFIDNMTNCCTYLPYADVLPKMSLCYERFQVLNEINPISVNGRRIPVEVKQRLYTELFMNRKKVTKKAICDFLRSNNYYTQDELLTLSGVDDTIKSSLTMRKAFNNLITSAIISEDDAEAIIKHRTYTESKRRFALWLEREYPQISENDRKYICSLNIKDFGRLSREFLFDLYGTESNNSTGEAFSVLERMWNENLTLMEILSDRYTYKAYIETEVSEYYGAEKKTLDQRLSDMYISNAVKRPILRALDIVSDVVKAKKSAPTKIFIEMARGGTPDQKGNRTFSRYAQILKLYEKCDAEDVRELTKSLEAMGDSAESKLQGDKLFLYYMQLGRCMYTGEPINLSQISSKLYDIDHIYPRSKVKDDSVLNNKVLVTSQANGDKGDSYPIKEDCRKKMHGYWKCLQEQGLITEEKFKRLTRITPFDENEQWGFINRQLVETRQSTKAIAAILKDMYPECEVVYVKAGLVSEFRQEFDMLKSRAVNDLHHAKDAYLNIVVGNVYNQRFTKNWFLENRDSYNLKVSTLFSHPVTVSGKQIWNGGEDIGRIKNVVHNKNAIHLTRYAFCRQGSLFDQQPVKAAEGLVSLKKGLPTEKYGGYNKPSASFFILTKYQCGKKTEVMIMPVELMVADKFKSDINFAFEYAKDNISKIIGKAVDNVEFPLGMRIIKVNTVLELDGMRACIAGKSGGGKCIVFSLLQPLILGYKWEKYIKKLEQFIEKRKNNPNLLYSEKYDGITSNENIELYTLLIDKLSKPSYIKRPANPYSTLYAGIEKFTSADINDQAYCLLQIIALFGRLSGGCDLRTVGGAGKAGAMVNFSSSVSNWKKSFKDVRIVDMSAAGIYEKESVNLLELL